MAARRVSRIHAAKHLSGIACTCEPRFRRRAASLAARASACLSRSDVRLSVRRFSCCSNVSSSCAAESCGNRRETAPQRGQHQSGVRDGRRTPSSRHVGGHERFVPGQRWAGPASPPERSRNAVLVLEKSRALVPHCLCHRRFPLTQGRQEPTPMHPRERRPKQRCQASCNETQGSRVRAQPQV